MQYISQINAFERWLETNTLGATSQLLWYKLMYKCNRCGWQEWFEVNNQRLMAEMTISKPTLWRARDELIESGLIEYKKGKKGLSGKYRIVAFYETNDETNVKPMMKPICNQSRNQYETNRETSNKTRIRQDIDIEKENKEKNAKRFTPPTFDEVKKYISDNNYNVDASIFFDYYTSNGWLVGKNKMKDWKATVRRWNSTEKSKSKKSEPQKKSSSYDLNAFNQSIGQVPKYKGVT